MLCLNILLLLSLGLFLYGFFPIPSKSNTFSNAPPDHVAAAALNTTVLYKPRFNKTVLMVIDALRWDFVTPELMPLTTNMMLQKGCLSKVSVESPTVTLPRIKALTTGSIPQYVDVVRNLASSEILTDSWLHSAKNKGMRTVFYGDNTWEKLFPRFFTRSEGTTSFFVWDFTEVDNNVTKNVNLELETLDWDLMIMHYLGLDHIGHVLGPFSSKIPSKLHEMDQIIHKIYEAISATESLILVTGDHGMRDAGGHGGTSQPEVMVPLVAIGLDCKNSSFKQTDIPVNLAILLGLDIPSSSIGRVQRDFLSSLTLPEYLLAIRYNVETLLKKIGNHYCEESFKNATSLHEKYLLERNVTYGLLALVHYDTCSVSVTEELYEASSKQNMPLLIISILLLFSIVASTILNLLHVCYGLWELATLFTIIILSFFTSLFYIVLSLLVVYALYKFVICVSVICNHSIAKLSGVHLYVLAICIIHPLTFMSTSFIEEEHYFWVFCSTTLLLVQMLQPQGVNGILMTISKPIQASLSFANLSELLAILCLRFAMDLNSTVENTVQNDNNWANILIVEQNYVYHQIFFTFNLLLMFVTLYTPNMKQNVVNLIILGSIFLVKSLPFHSPMMGKIIWLLIVLKKVVCGSSIIHLWSLVSALLLKPHNIILVPLAYYVSNVVSSSFRNKTGTLAVATYMLSNSFYFLQGHRNSLATVDVSVGYIGLSDYYPVIVLSQVLAHTYVLPVLFHLVVLPNISIKEQKGFWAVLVTLRASVVLSTSLVTLGFRHHLFVWSVFAPKLIIESVHTITLFIEIVIWYLYNYLLKT